MKFSEDGTFVERTSWGVVSTGRWSFGYAAQLSYDNNSEGRVILSDKEDKITIDLIIPPGHRREAGLPPGVCAHGGKQDSG